MDPLSTIRSFEPARVASSERARKPRRRGSREDEYNSSQNRRQDAEEEQLDRFEPSSPQTDD